MRKVNDTIEFSTNRDYLLEHWKDSSGYCYMIWHLDNGKKVYDHSRGYIETKKELFHAVDSIISYYKDEYQKGKITWR